MANQKSVELIETLYRKTMSGELNWDETLVNDIFQISYPNFSVKIFERESFQGMDVVVQIFNDEAILVEEITDVDITEMTGYDGSRAYDMMHEMFLKARTHALGTEEFIDEVIKQLNSPETSEDENEIPF